MSHDYITAAGLMLFVACLVAIFSRRVGLPYAVGLVAAGIGLNYLSFGNQISFTPELIFSFFLPPIVFEAALNLKWKQFLHEAPLVLNLAFIGTVLSAGVVAAGMHWIVGWSWGGSFVFGSLIAATDPVSVIATMKEQRAEARLRFIMESESLSNDGAAAVLFTICVGAVQGASVAPGSIALSLVVIVLGSLATGLGTAVVLLLVAGRTEEPFVELTLTVLIAYASFTAAEALGFSGVLSTLSAGMLVGNWTSGRGLSKRGRESMIHFWEFVAFVANSVIFLLIGSAEARQSFGSYLGPALVGTALALAGRAFSIYVLGPLYSRSMLSISWMIRHVLFWGGLRGALGLALALSTPASLREHDALVGTAFAVVAFSIFVQGVTMPLLLRRSGLLAENGD